MFDDRLDVAKEIPLHERFPRIFKLIKVLGFCLILWWLVNYFVDGFDMVVEEKDRELSKIEAKKKFADFLATYGKSYDDPIEFEERLQQYAKSYF